MKRGEIWTVSGGSGYAGKPRPAVVVQSDDFSASQSLTVCGFTREEPDAVLFRLAMQPDAHNGLRHSCQLMVDKIMTVPKIKLGEKIGELADDDMLRVNRALLVFLGLAATLESELRAARLSTRRL